MNNETTKKTFFIVSANTEFLNTTTDYLKKHYQQPIIDHSPYTESALSKIKSEPVDVVIADCVSNAALNFTLVENLIKENLTPTMSYILIGPPPKEAKFVDELVSGKVSYLSNLDEEKFDHVLVKALNFNSHADHASFHLLYLAQGDLLMKQGDIAEYVYILKSGELQAFNTIDGKKTILGHIAIGEFVGEMAYINNEPRSASIEALTDAELIEVPLKLVDTILYTRPAWAKSLNQTLSKRLKQANLSPNKK